MTTAASRTRTPLRARRAVTVLAILVLLGGSSCGDSPAQPEPGTPSSRDAGTVPPGADGSPPIPESETPPLGPRVFRMDLAAALDGPGRDAWQHPDEVVAALGVRPGDKVADIGCGTGYFTLRLLRAAGPAGRVVAVDIQQGMLDRLAARLLPDDRARVTLRRSPPDRPLEPTDAIDLAFVANTLHEVDDADAARFVKSLADGLAPGGRLATLDWLPEPMRIGPPADERISPARVRELVAQAGLAFTSSLDVLPTHSFLVFTKAK